ncbi:MAG: helix-turn-helix transcriptional regulator [Verrucomicrobia bacterium]|nr:helix-turn-helix transcriptional regulator [Verrucomicrobiota bacterium]
MRKELVAASAEPLILSLLAEGDSYGYAILQEIRARSREEIQWTDGMLYPVLHRLEDNGWITSRWVEIENGRKRKYYSIRKGGLKALKTQREEWLAVHRVLTSFGGSAHV